MSSRVWLYATSMVLSSVGYAQPVAPRISVTTNPPGAKVYVDGKDKGLACQSGPSCKPRMSKGTHRLLLEMDGFKSIEETINVTGPQTFTFALQPAPARLNIKNLATNPSALGGEVFVDGKLVGSVPAELEVAAGKHMVEVRRPGYQPYAEVIEVKGGESQPMFVALATEGKISPTTGSLTVTSESPGSEVIIDEQPRGPAPVLVEGLSPGDHVVEIRSPNPNYQPWRRNVRVAAGQQAAAYATFTANPPPPPSVIEAGPTSPVAFVPRSPDNAYVVTLPSGQSCTTPCSLNIPPGGQVVNVSGPGSNAFREPVSIPTVPAQVTVQHFTGGRLAGGIVMTILGIPLIALGSMYIADPRSLPRDIRPDTYDASTAIGAVLGIHGIGLTLGGIIAMATTKTNRADVQALGPSNPRLASRPVWSPLLTLSPDRSGGLAGVRASF